MSPKIPSLRVLRKASFAATPWKNGGGITHEAIRVPASGDTFRWRISVAHIDVSGPFSDFSAYNRTMVLLHGAGLELRFAGGERRVLRQMGELAEFDGAVPTECKLLDGPCVDLNLMVCKGETAFVRVERLIEPLALGATNQSTLVFPINDAIELQADSGEAAALEPWDLALFSFCGGRVTLTRPRDSVAPSLVFVAIFFSSQR